MGKFSLFTCSADSCFGFGSFYLVCVCALVFIAMAKWRYICIFFFFCVIIFVPYRVEFIFVSNSLRAG